MHPISIAALARILGAAVTRRTVPSDSERAAPYVTGVSTDSRTASPGDCFFAIRGEHFDGHDYVAQAFRKGAACAVVSLAVSREPISGPVLRVPDTIRALGDLARQYRRSHPFTVVAITGSVGKTTTRQIIHHVLSQRFRTHQAVKSFNNNIGLPLTLLSAQAQEEVIVTELGANHPGEIAYLTRIAQPNIALVTNVYPAHLEGFGNLAAIIREKLSIAEGLTSDGTLIINADIEPLVAACRGSGRSFRTFGKSADATYRAENVAFQALDSTFTIAGTQVRLPLPGPGNVENALAAWAVCDQLGLSAEAFAQAVATLQGIAMRAEPMQIGTLTVLNDCYNANPASMKNALVMLRNLRPSAEANHNRRLVFICGEMAELGEQTASLHAELGSAVAEAGVDLLVTIGEPPRVTARAAQEATRRHLTVQSFDDVATACNHMEEFIRQDDIVLVKGSRTARLERVVERLPELFASRACDAVRGTR
ncbi:MAG: UDP-N-acetylmuramoyl-tripeptide--D-alanyl-D-alanine ligase [Sedimentisphaerales bacterium]|nr:UDP-N-acetylmuramoyl-tripeptide--D-alanyl-D-alanine ligase [Sedimentisphaerales bacterium]